LARKVRQVSGPESRVTVNVGCGTYYPILSPAAGTLTLHVPSHDSNTSWVGDPRCGEGLQPTVSGGVPVPESTRHGGGGGGWTEIRPGVWQALLATPNAIPLNTTRLMVGGQVRTRRVRTQTLRWVRSIEPSQGGYNAHCDPAHLAAGGELPTNCFGFVYNASDIPAFWDTSAAATGRWRVGAMHAFASSYVARGV